MLTQRASVFPLMLFYPLMEISKQSSDSSAVSALSMCFFPNWPEIAAVIQALPLGRHLGDLAKTSWHQSCETVAYCATGKLITDYSCEQFCYETIFRRWEG